MRPGTRPRTLLVRGAMIALALGPAVGRAQATEGSVDVGAQAVDVRSLGSSVALFASGRLRLATPAWGVTGLAAVAGGDAGAPAGFLQLGADVGPAAHPGWRTELDGYAGGALQFDGVSGAAHLRQRGTWLGLGLYAGGAVGTTRRAATTSANTMAEAGVVLPIDAIAFTLDARQVRTADWPLVEAAGHVLSRPASAYDLRDVALGVQWRGSQATIAASATWRAGYQATTGRTAALAAAVQVPFGPERALTIALGRTLADPMRGTPDVTGVSLSFRWLWPAAPRGSHVTLAEATVVRDSGAAATLWLEVDAPADARVEYTASFLDWQPRAMTRERSRFVARVPLPSGNHRVAVRVNGGAWQAPDGLPRLDDDLGGASGIVVVP